MWKAQVGAVVVLGGDGTCRDVAIGWPDAPLIAISTGTNNVFPSTVDGTTAGVAAGLVATGAVPVDTVGRQAKRVSLAIDDPSRPGSSTTTRSSTWRSSTRRSSAPERSATRPRSAGWWPASPTPRAPVWPASPVASIPSAATSRAAC